jgi:hypothetical protein
MLGSPSQIQTLVFSKKTKWRSEEKGTATVNANLIVPLSSYPKGPSNCDRHALVGIPEYLLLQVLHGSFVLWVFTVARPGCAPGTKQATDILVRQFLPRCFATEFKCTIVSI